MMKASIIILSWNGMSYLGPCLDAVLAQDYPDFEVIVVDNGSADGSADFVATRYPQVRLIRNARNLGFAAGSNIGLRAAAGEVLVLLNQDTEVCPGWLAALVTALQDPTIGIVGCKLLYPNGTIQHAGGRIVDSRGSARHIGRDEIDEGQYDAIQDVDFVTGAALALTRTTFACIGPLDEGFMPAYYEDTDWCYRTREAGLRVIYCPSAMAIHYESASSVTSSYTHQVNFHSGRLRFLFKHLKLEDLWASFVPAESEGIQNLGPGGELEALRQAWMNLLLSLPDILEFRLRFIEPDMDPQMMGESLFQIAMTLRGLCAKEQPFYIPREPSVAAQPEIWNSQLASLYHEGEITPQPFRSSVPVIGPAIVAFRETWLSMAARWYIQPLIMQQRVFNAHTVQLLNQITDNLNQIADNLNQIADNSVRSQQENAQHVRELNTLLSELLHLQKRVAELEGRLL